MDFTVKRVERTFRTFYWAGAVCPICPVST